MGNIAPDAAILWSFAGIFALLVVLGLVIHIVHRCRFFYGEPRLVRPELWNDRLLRISFWGLNLGLGAMSLFSLLPVGILEMVTSYSSGLWVAKSAEFFNRPVIQFLGQIRIVPDTVIILLGAVPLALFLLTSIRNLKKPEVGDGEAIFDDAEEDTAAL